MLPFVPQPSFHHKYHTSTSSLKPPPQSPTMHLRKSLTLLTVLSGGGHVFALPQSPEIAQVLTSPGHGPAPLVRFESANSGHILPRNISDQVEVVLFQSPEGDSGTRYRCQTNTKRTIYSLFRRSPGCVTARVGVSGSGSITHIPPTGKVDS